MDRWTDSIPGWTGKGDCVSLVNRFEVLRYELLRHVDDCDSRPDGESDVVHGCQRPRYAAAPFQLSTYMASDCDRPVCWKLFYSRTHVVRLCLCVSWLFSEILLFLYDH
jgi:hypothetical protein